MIVAPRGSNSSSASTTLDRAFVKQVLEFPAPLNTSAVSNLYLVVDVSTTAEPHQAIKVVAAGKRAEKGPTVTIRVHALGQSVAPPASEIVALVGFKAAQQLKMQISEPILLRFSGREEAFRAAPIPARGDETDNQISIPLEAAQRLANLPDQVSLIQLSVPGTPREIREYIAALAQKIPGADVHGLRQFTDAEAKIYDRISGLLTATTILVLALTGLCVMAAMTNVAMERKGDVGLMRAIGGATRRVMRLFLAEAALLGLTGGLVGAAAGLLLSVWLGKTVFGVAARPRLIVYPVSVALTIIVAILSAYPLRRLANISPASVFRGEE